MGFSWVISGHVEMDAKKLASFKSAAIDPSRYAWPDTWGTPNESDEWKVDALVKAMIENADAKKIEWNKTGLKILALFSNDSSLWLDLRSHMASLVHVAGEREGTGEISITGFIDGGPSDVYRVTANGKTPSAMDVLTSRAAKAIADPIIDEAMPLVDALLETFNEATPKSNIPKSILAIHARVCAELRKHAKNPKLAATLSKASVRVHYGAKSASKSPFGAPGSKYDFIQKAFPGAKVIDAIENGWDFIDERAAIELAPLALRLLAAIDLETARTLAKEYRGVKAEKNTRAFVDEIGKEIRAVTTNVDSEKDCVSALVAMRKAIPKAPHFMLHNSLAKDPAVRALRERNSATLHRVAQGALIALGGTPPKFKKLSPADQVYAYALTLVIDAHATKDDREILFRYWTDSPGFMLLDHGRVNHSEGGKEFMASLYGRKTKSQYAAQEQQFAAQFALELDPKRAVDVTKKLIATKKLTWEYEHAASSLFEKLAAEKKPRREWLPILKSAQTRADEVGVAALRARIAWKEPGAAAIVMQHLASGFMDVSNACDFLEKAKDKSVRKKLEAHLASRPKNALRERNRIEQCLKALK